MKKNHLLLALLGIVAFFFSCSTDIDVNAPEKDIWAVYTVLDQSDTVQYVRIAKAFLIEGNAEEYAANTDLSVSGLNVTLEGNGKTYTAVEVDSLEKEPAPPEGVFLQQQTLYRFETKPGRRIVKGERYTLRITKPGDDSFEITAYAYVPFEPRISQPSLSPGPGQFRCLQQVRIHQTYELNFRRDNEVGSAKGFEVRVFFAYEENGVPKTRVFGPTDLFTESNGCVSGNSSYCYRFSEGQLLTSLKVALNDPAATYTYQDEPSCAEPENLAQSFWFEVTAIDTFLTNYIIANDPKFTDLLTDRAEYTNLEIQANDDEDVVGVFGAIAKDIEYAALDECPEYLLRLNGSVVPPPDCNP